MQVLLKQQRGGKQSLVEDMNMLAVYLGRHVVNSRFSLDINRSDLGCLRYLICLDGVKEVSFIDAIGAEQIVIVLTDGTVETVPVQWSKTQKRVYKIYLHRFESGNNSVGLPANVILEFLS